MKHSTLLFALGLISAALALPAQAANPARGKEKAVVCAACHGEGGDKPILGMYPRLAGQHEDYLNQALRAYKNGTRKNEIMKAQVQTLTPEDMADLAAYFSRQKGTLETKR